MLYFAYGSNLSHKQMQKRCPGYRYLGNARLKNYKRVFDGVSDLGGGVANVIPKSNSNVQGCIYDISEENLRALDKYERYRDKVYDRQILPVETTDGNIVDSIVYLRAPLKADQPSPKYLAIIKEGLLDCGINLSEIGIEK